ncbi:hypothetical protein TrVGV298_004945 [Trichoderma virens]|nr:hypothetical protein TrVGV298_004945 [Trichoderma virens]
MPSSGKVNGIFNTKWLYFASVALFEVGSAICGASPNMNALIIGRVVAGAGGAGLYLEQALYINLVLFAATSTIFIFVIPSLDPRPGRKFSQRLGGMDWIGAILNAGIYALLVLGLSFGGAEWVWSSGRTIAVFVVCGVVIILFAL